MKKSGSLILLFLWMVSCVPPTEEVYHEVTIDFKDPTIRHIIDLQVEQDLDSLLLFTNDPNPANRFFAANAFASFQTEEAYDSLVGLLQDPFIEVKTAAAFALGQIRNPSAANALLEAFTQQDSIDVNNAFNEAVLEAMGKVGSEPYLKSIATVSTYRPTDTMLVKGQANAIYQYGLRDIFAPEGDQVMLKFLVENYPLSIQKMAAQYFYRFEKAELSESKFQALQVMKEHSDPDIRMALGTALTRLGAADLRRELFDFYSQESDYRVRCNILRQIHKYPYISIVERILGELSSPNEKIGLSAANYLLNHGNAYDAPVYRQYIKADQSPYVQVRTHQAILRNSGINSGSRGASNRALKAMFEEADDYLKGEIIVALSEDPRHYTFLIENYDASLPPIVKTKTMEALVNMMKNERYYRFLGGSGGVNAKKNIADFIKSAFENDSGGFVAAATEAFANEDLNFSDQYEDLGFLKTALDKMVLPNELEAYNALNKVIAAGRGGQVPDPLISDNIKSVNWETFDQYSSKPTIRINTTKGDIELKLFKEEAPQSVMSIIELVKTGYYNNKFFHRVVPNFVAQAGCPDGDGYGSLNYTIRSELKNVHYDDEGYIGFASAGPHTESTQWFITHSPTPHLNGKYTIFGKVSDGMDVVHQLSVGDKINRISISN